jgi:wyosine [tRNA(Phe)-imidazoG37] synthetase (radical SAM superfamily)
LGIDLTPYKTCTLDCVFCQLGRTTRQTLERRPWVPVETVIDEIDDWIARCGEADYMTLSGSGEPTLHSEFGRVLECLRHHPIPSVLLTNGTLLTRPDVREAAALADVVKVSLSAWDQASFERIHRPHPALNFEAILDGMIRFRQVFDGELWLEVFLLSGINESAADVKRIADLSRKLAPRRIHLNTIARPPAEKDAVAVPLDTLAARCTLFDPPAMVAAGFSPHRSRKTMAGEAEILAMLKRRPCTIAQIMDVFGMHINEITKMLSLLLNEKRIHADPKGTDVYYGLTRRGREEKTEQVFTPRPHSKPVDHAD